MRTPISLPTITMNAKEEKPKAENIPTTNGIKILNDEKNQAKAGAGASAVTTSIPLSPEKQVSMGIAKTKSKVSPTLTQKKMDHYVMHTIKGEKNAEGVEEGDIINFVLTENNDDVAEPSGEILEEMQFTDDEGPDDGDEHTQEIVEHVCGKCFKTFRRLRGLKKHLDYCRFDSGYHLRKAEMLKNLEKIEKDAVIMENKDVCFCCGESYDTYHLGHISCPDCPKSFKTQMSYERHIFITHSEFNDHPCSLCNAKLRSGNLLTLHEEQHRIRGKPFACKICGKDFTRSYHLSRHQKYSSCSASACDAMPCKVCNKTFYRLDNLRSHLKQHLGTQVTKKSEYMCPICKKCFTSLSTLNIHTRTHTGERPFDCDLCEKKFPSLVALKKHRRYHTGEKPYTCSVCKQSFAVKEVLNRHMKRHTGERPHECNECGKRFIQATQLRTHSRTHIRPHECETCHEKFKTQMQLTKHAKSHNTSATKRRGRSAVAHKCSVCKTSFKTELEYNKHMEAGEHITPRQKRVRKNRTDCAVCNENFDCHQSLQFHILKEHQEDPETFLNENPFRKDEEGESTANTPDAMPQPAQEFIKIEDPGHSQRIEYVTTNSEGKILNSSIEGLTNDHVASTAKRESTSARKVQILEEFIIDEGHGAANVADKQTIVLSNEAFTVIPLDSDGGLIEPVTTKSLAEAAGTAAAVAKKEQRKSLAESLAAAIADDDNMMDYTASGEDGEELSKDDLKLKDNVGKLLDMLVDSTTLKKFGWPEVSEEKVLCKVIENCGHNLSNEQFNYHEWEYGSRMREYVKLLFTVVIHNDSIKELLNNYPIDEVIEYVLGNDDDDDDDDEDEENKHEAETVSDQEDFKTAIKSEKEKL